METSGLEYFIETEAEETHAVPQIPPVSSMGTKLSTLKAAIPHAFLIVSSNNNYLNYSSLLQL